MNLEGRILTAAVLISLICLMPPLRKKPLQTQFVFLFVQFATWLLGLSVVEMGLLEYPYREFASVNRTSFIFEYLVLPAVCVQFNNYYPWRASTLVRSTYLLGVSLLFTGGEFVLERYTRLVKYTGWEWYWTWITIAFIFWLTQKAVVWFFRYR